MPKDENYYQELAYAELRKAGSHTVMYHPRWGEYLGSNNSAIILNQLLYWQTKYLRKGRDTFFIPQREFKRQLNMNRSAVDSALKILVDKGLVSISLKGGIPATRHFVINEQNVRNMATSLLESYKLDGDKGPQRASQKQQSNKRLPKNNSKEITPEIRNRNLEHYRQLKRDHFLSNIEIIES